VLAGHILYQTSDQQDGPAEDTYGERLIARSAVVRVGDIACQILGNPQQERYDEEDLKA